MTPKAVAASDQAKFRQLNEVRAAALEHAKRSWELSRQRKALIAELIAAGYSQSDIAREMGVTRQAVQKMVTLG